MNFDDYVKERTRIFSEQKTNKDCLNLLWASNALSGETGEFANIVKKVYRDMMGNPNLAHEDLLSELGDVLWYWIFVCDTLDIKPEAVMQYNMTKLRKRHGIKD